MEPQKKVIVKKSVELLAYAAKSIGDHVLDFVSDAEAVGDDKDARIDFALTELASEDRQFIRAGLAADLIDREKLYLEFGCSSLSEFAETQLQMSASRISRFKNAAAFGELLANRYPDADLRESHIRELRPLLKDNKTDEALAVWEDVAKGKKMTAEALHEHETLKALRSKNSAGKPKPKKKAKRSPSSESAIKLLLGFQPQIDDLLSEGATQKITELLKEESK